MNRRILLLAISGAAGGYLYRGQRRLNVFNWENYIADLYYSQL